MNRTHSVLTGDGVVGNKYLLYQILSYNSQYIKSLVGEEKQNYDGRVWQRGLDAEKRFMVAEGDRMT